MLAMALWTQVYVATNSLSPPSPLDSGFLTRHFWNHQTIWCEAGSWEPVLQPSCCGGPGGSSAMSGGGDLLHSTFSCPIFITSQRLVLSFGPKIPRNCMMLTDHATLCASAISLRPHFYSRAYSFIKLLWIIALERPASVSLFNPQVINASGNYPELHKLVSSGTKLYFLFFPLN